MDSRMPLRFVKGTSHEWHEQVAVGKYKVGVYFIQQFKAKHII